MPRILLIEDNVELTVFVRAALKFYAPYFNLEIKFDGERGLNAAKNSPPDLILLDIMLPGMDGIEVCKRLRKIESVKDTPIVLLTALSQVGDKRRGYEAGANSYFTKPFDMSRLISEMNQLLGWDKPIQSDTKELNSLLSTSNIQKQITSRPRFDQSIPRVTVIVPTFNDADNLPEILPWIPDWVSEVILVDGHSTDGTVEAALSLRPDIKIQMRKKTGKDNTPTEVFRSAVGDIIIMLNSDGSTDPAEIPAFVGALMAGADFAKGSRFLQGGGAFRMSFFCKVGNIGFVQLARLLFSGKYTDLLCGYIAFWARVLPMIQVDSDVPELQTTMSIRALRNGLRITEVPSFESTRLSSSQRFKSFPDGWSILKMLLNEFQDHRSNHDKLSKQGFSEKDAIFGPTVGRMFREALAIWRSRKQITNYEELLEQMRNTYLQMLERDYQHPHDIALRDFYLATYGQKVPWVFAEEACLEQS